MARTGHFHKYDDIYKCNRCKFVRNYWGYVSRVSSSQCGRCGSNDWHNLRGQDGRRYWHNIHHETTFDMARSRLQGRGIHWENYGDKYDNPADVRKEYQWIDDVPFWSCFYCKGEFDYELKGSKCIKCHQNEENEENEDNTEEDDVMVQSSKKPKIEINEDEDEDEDEDGNNEKINAIIKDTNTSTSITSNNEDSSNDIFRVVRVMSEYVSTGHEDKYYELCNTLSTNNNDYYHANEMKQNKTKHNNNNNNNNNKPDIASIFAEELENIRKDPSFNNANHLAYLKEILHIDD